MRSWIEAFPDRFEHELAEFERRGLRFQLDEQRLREAGRVVLSGVLPYRAEQVEIQVAYPDSFPFMRPAVFAPGLRLERHQNPVNRNLCLLDRSTLAWNVSDTAAWLVAERVPYLLDLLAEGGEALVQGEVPQGEPASSYFEREAGAVVFIPHEMLELPSEHISGVFRLAVGRDEVPQPLLRACMRKVSTRDEQNQKLTLAELSAPLADRFAGKAIEGRWVRLPRFPYGGKPRDLMVAAIEANPKLARPQWQRIPGGADISVVGVVASEEVEQGKWQDAWLFVVSVRKKVNAETKIYTAAGERLARGDLLARLPVDTRLNDSSVGVVGIGSVGAPLAVELLRAQVGELRVLDFDVVEAGNTVRWTHGLSAIGYPKAGLIGGWAAAEFPFTSVVALDMRIGYIPSLVLRDREQNAGEAERPGEAKRLNDFLDGLDVAIDASGELGVQHLLATIAHENGIPQLFAWGTEGGWGGAVACLTPAAGGCWMCLQLAFDDGSIELPPAAPDVPFQPRGCADPTFAAAGFSLTPIVAQAAKCVARLVNGNGGGQVHVCSQQTEQGELPAPHWVSSEIPVHPACPCEHERA